MWYFYNKFDYIDLDKLINQINGLFASIFLQEAYEYPPWMKNLILKSHFEDFKKAYEKSTRFEKNRLSDAYEHNIQIESICKTDIDPLSYDDLLFDASKEFSLCLQKLKSIQNYLYNNLLKLKGFEETVGTLKNYYDNFYEETIEFVCPFCGLDNMLTSNDAFREAFDHYLPKSKYPFVTFIRENLFPICHTCNSIYKSDKNPIDVGRAFYPFSTDQNDCTLAFRIISGEIEGMEISSERFSEEIETWDALFDIRNRIVNFAGVNIYSWTTNILEVMEIYGVDYEFAKNAEINVCNPKMQGHKFIKKAVLEAL